MSQDGAAAARDSSSSNRLEPPLFQLPENMNDYEVWTVRLPASLNVDSLQGVELDVSESTANTFQTQHDQQWSMTRGQAFDNEQFRLLIRDDDNDEFLVPHHRPFDRHYNISTNHTQVVEAQLAPRLEMAPEPTDTFRQSYSHIPQVSGLKRRWMPPGGGSVVTKKMKCERVNGTAIEESVAAIPTSPVKKETRAVHSTTTSVALSTHDTPPSSNQTPKEEPYMNGEHVSSKKKAKKHKKDKKKKKEKKKRRSKTD